MKTRKLLVLITAVLTLLIIMPTQTFASDTDRSLLMPRTKDEIEIPPAHEISADPNFSDSLMFSGGLTAEGLSEYATRGVLLAGYGSIGKVSSTSIGLHGNTFCSVKGVTVTLIPQAYYNGRWNSMTGNANTSSGTFVDLTVTRNVTSGYYYRLAGVHIGGGTSMTTYTGAMLID